jgi:prepilin-type N-terminal cleavage/methylation domain-containing protein
MKAYTLIEFVIVLVLLAILAGIGVPMMLKTVDAWSLTSRFQDYAMMSSIMAMNRMSLEIRRLMNDAAITTATSSRINFRDISSNYLGFNLRGTTLQRCLDAACSAPDDLANNVTALTFTYYDDLNTTIATPIVGSNTNIRRIDITFSMLAGSNTLKFTTEVRPQNLMRYSEKFK